MVVQQSMYPRLIQNQITFVKCQIDYKTTSDPNRVSDISGPSRRGGSASYQVPKQRGLRQQEGNE